MILRCFDFKILIIGSCFHNVDWEDFMFYSEKTIFRLILSWTNFWQDIFKSMFYSRYLMWQPNENLILCTLYGMETDCNVKDTDREAII